MASLQLANAVRSGKALTKRDLRRLEPPAALEFAAAIVDGPSFAEGAFTTLDLLVACPTVGAVKASQILRLVSISPRKRLRSLSQRQRDQLAFAIRVAASERRRRDHRPARRRRTSP